jgi:hypothetical protein
MEDTLQFGARPNRRNGRPTPRIGYEHYLYADLEQTPRLEH